MIKMDLKETVDKALADLNTIPADFHKWNTTLKDELKKRSLADYEKRIKKIGVGEADKVIAVLEKLRERFKYTFIEENLSSKDRSDFDRILELCRLEGKVLDMLDSLADTGYFLGYTNKKNKNIIEYDIKIFKRLIKDDTFKKYKTVFNDLEACLSYEYDEKSNQFPFYEHQFHKIIDIAELEGDVHSSICLLANRGYQIDKNTGLTDTHVKAIGKIAKSLQEEKSSLETVSSILYKEGNLEIFKHFFSGLPDDKQRTVLEKIFDTDYENKKIIAWLNKEQYDLLQEVGFS